MTFIDSDSEQRLEGFRKSPLRARYSVYGYEEMINIYLKLEEAVEREEILKFSIAKVAVRISPSKRSYDIDVTSKVPPSVMHVDLTPLAAFDDDKIRAKIKKIHSNGNRKVIEVHSGNKRAPLVLDTSKWYRLDFVPNLVSLQRASEAVEKIKEQGFECFMLNFEYRKFQLQKMPKFSAGEFGWRNPNVATNDAQKRTIMNIVNRTSFPSPFVCFGGPGCGKTSMAVEAITQIILLLPHAKILVTAASNSACDEIGERLLDYVSKECIYRVYSSHLLDNIDKISSKLYHCSNLTTGDHQVQKRQVEDANVVIATLVKSAVLEDASFDFIIIDESASAAEAFMCIPISLAMESFRCFSTSIVLLGDPRQLGQVMKNFRCEKFGFGISMMERMMELDKYRYHETTGYNETYIVQLTDNFRSHNAIIQFSNEEFYNARLVARQAKEISDFAIGWRHLPNAKCPLIFQANFSESETVGRSLINVGELELVKAYVGLMLTHGINGQRVRASDVGIVIPYVSQREQLKSFMHKGIEIGTTEYFQGREKLIIIVSCVRSGTQTIGFLKNNRRLNVALTRAKALLIVIGNPDTLMKNGMWRKFINYCKRSNAYRRKLPLWFDESLEDFENLVFEETSSELSESDSECSYESDESDEYNYETPSNQVSSPALKYLQVTSPAIRPAQISIPFIKPPQVSSPALKYPQVTSPVVKPSQVVMPSVKPRAPAPPTTAVAVNPISFQQYGPVTGPANLRRNATPSSEQSPLDPLNGNIKERKTVKSRVLGFFSRLNRSVASVFSSKHS